MEPRGMVHALEEIHRLLQPGGTLIDIHPVQDAWVEVRLDGNVLFTESDPGYDPDDDIGSTEGALRSVLDHTLFVLDGTRTFELLCHAPSVPELRDYFAVIGGYDKGADDSNVIRLRDQLYRRAQGTLSQAGKDAEVVYRERARMSRLSGETTLSTPSTHTQLG
jgi:hypothetical protein